MQWKCMQNRGEGRQSIAKEKICSSNLQMQSLVLIKSMILLNGQGVKANTGKYEDFLGIEKLWRTDSSWKPNRSTVQVPKNVPLRQKERDKLKEQVANNLQKNKGRCFFLKFKCMKKQNVYSKSKRSKAFLFHFLYSIFLNKTRFLNQSLKLTTVYKPGPEEIRYQSAKISW